MDKTLHPSTSALISAAAVLVLLVGIALAQDPPAKPSPSHTSSASAGQQMVMPDAETIVLLVRTTLLTLNDALQTGNFTVLRDIAAPGFRDANSAARLSSIFADLSQRTDLAPVAILTPQLDEPPTIDMNTGMLRIRGWFPGQPGRLDVEVIYQRVRGQWRLFGLAVQPVTALSGTAATTAGTNSSPGSVGKFAPTNAHAAPARTTDQRKSAPPGR